MFRIIIPVCVIVCLACLYGCGGGSGNSTSPFVDIEATRFFAKNTTIQKGSLIQWVNVDAAPHQVVSGRLSPQGSPLVIHIIQITLTGFNPVAVTANLGDSVFFNNISGSPFTMDVVDDNGVLVSTVVFNIGDMKQFTFPGAGLFAFRQNGSQIFQGTIVLFSQPTPDGLFMSPVLLNGEVFARQFDVPGQFSFFDLDLNNPNQSFKTGTITVQ